MSPLGLLFIAATVWIVFMVSHKRSGRSGGFSLFTALGAVSVLAGLFVFASRDAENVPSSSHPTSSVSDVPDIDVPEVDVPDIDIDIDPPDIDISFDRGFPFRSWRPDIKVRPSNVDVRFNREHPRYTTHSQRGTPTWMAIALGSVLLIVGSLLVTRGRTRPLAFKALTLLGAGAVVYSLVSFFSSTPRPIGPHDRVVRLNSQREVTELAPRATAEPERPKRPPRAKRPASRRERPSHVEALPPRAGSIPVDAELTAREAQTAPSAAATPDKPDLTPEEKEKPAVVSDTTSPSAVISSPAESTAPAPEAAAPSEAAPAAAESKAAPAAAPVATTSAAPVVTPVANEKPAETPAAAPPQPDAAPSPPAVTIAAEVSEARPEWVDAPAKLHNSVYSITVSSGLFVTLPECQRQLDAQIKHEADHYIDEYLGEQASTLVDIPISYLRDHVRKAEYAEIARSESVGPMHQIHALLNFDDRSRSDFRRMWHNAVVTDRLWYTGSGAALVLALLGTFYGYLKLDLRTGGAQKGRLQLAATLLALIIAAGALLARWAVPF